MSASGGATDNGRRRCSSRRNEATASATVGRGGRRSRVRPLEMCGPSAQSANWTAVVAAQVSPQVAVLGVEEQLSQRLQEVAGLSRRHDASQGLADGVAHAAVELLRRAHRWYRAPQRDGSHGPHVGWQIPRWDLAARGGDSVDGKPVRRHASHELIAPDADSPIVERVRALRDEADVEHTAAIGCRHHNIVVCTAQAQVPPHSKSPAIPVGSPGRDGTYGKRRLLAAPVFRTVHPCDAALLPGIFPRTQTRHPTNIDRVQAYPKPPSLVISTRRATPRNIRPTRGRCSLEDSQRAPRAGACFQGVGPHRGKVQGGRLG